MKTSQDPRHQRRIHVMQDLFAWESRHQNKLNFSESKQIVENLSQIDQEIEKAAPEWPKEQINRIDLAVLRLAVFELIILESKVPYKVTIDEAVELAKEFGSESSASFINGVLGKIVTAYKLDQKE